MHNRITTILNHYLALQTNSYLFHIHSKHLQNKLSSNKENSNPYYSIVSEINSE